MPAKYLLGFILGFLLSLQVQAAPLELGLKNVIDSKVNPTYAVNLRTSYSGNKFSYFYVRNNGQDIENILDIDGNSTDVLSILGTRLAFEVDGSMSKAALLIETVPQKEAELRVVDLNTGNTEWTGPKFSTWSGGQTLYVSNNVIIDLQTERLSSPARGFDITTGKELWQSAQMTEQYYGFKRADKRYFYIGNMGSLGPNSEFAYKDVTVWNPQTGTKVFKLPDLAKGIWETDNYLFVLYLKSAEEIVSYDLNDFTKTKIYKVPKIAAGDVVLSRDGRLMVDQRSGDILNLEQGSKTPNLCPPSILTESIFKFSMNSRFVALSCRSIIRVYETTNFSLVSENSKTSTNFGFSGQNDYWQIAPVLVSDDGKQVVSMVKGYKLTPGHQTWYNAKFAFWDASVVTPPSIPTKPNPAIKAIEGTWKARKTIDFSIRSSSTHPDEFGLTFRYWEYNSPDGTRTVDNIKFHDTLKLKQDGNSINDYKILFDDGKTEHEVGFLKFRFGTYTLVLEGLSDVTGSPGNNNGKAEKLTVTQVDSNKLNIDFVDEDVVWPINHMWSEVVSK